jgi:hypothetical protein
MKRLKIFIFGLMLTIIVTAKVAYSQGATTPSKGLNPSEIAASLADSSFWLTLLMTLVAGAIGGLVYELLILQGNIEWPHKLTEEEMTEKFPYAIVKYMIDLGIWARVIIGAFAALASLLVLSSSISTTFGLLATAVVAGSAGTSVFRSIQDRLLAAMAQKEAAETKNKARKQDIKVTEAMSAFAALKKKLVQASSSPAGKTTMKFASGADLDMDDLDKLEHPLSEAQGIHKTI